VTAGLILRPARLQEKPALDELCFRAKAHWGYDSDFMVRSREALRVPETAIRDGLACVATAGGQPRGVAALELVENGPVLLDLLFVEPAFIGSGIGAALFRWAAAAARVRGAEALEIHADPFAAKFYERMGARGIGSVPSGVIPGRRLPLYRLDL
jgi:GNAT superfamily N-acetyltransferase